MALYKAKESGRNRVEEWNEINAASSILPLKGAASHEWGFRFIPELTRITPAPAPVCGTLVYDHPAAPSSVRLNSEIKMDELMSMSGRAVSKTHLPGIRTPAVPSKF